MIQKFSSSILDIRVQFPLIPRFVYVQIDPNADLKQVAHEISQIPFGGGFLKLEPKIQQNAEPIDSKSIDPLSIFIGNIPTATPVQSIKHLVPLAAKVDVGHARKHRYGRYAFVKFRNAEDARNAYKSLKAGHKSATTAQTDLIVRFRRHRGAFGEVKRTLSAPAVIDLTQDDMQTTIKQELTDEDVKETPAQEDYQPIDWEKLRQQEMHRYEEKPDMKSLPSFPESLDFSSMQTSAEVTACDLDELFSQIDSEFNYAFNCDLGQI